MDSDRDFSQQRVQNILGTDEVEAARVKRSLVCACVCACMCVYSVYLSVSMSVCIHVCVCVFVCIHICISVSGGQRLMLVIFHYHSPPVF